MSDLKDIQKLLSFDRNHIWHPYTSIVKPVVSFPVESAEGVYIKLMDGRKLIDGMSSWWSAIHGYNHPVLNEAVKEQISKMSHVMFGGLTHEPAVKLAKKLIEITPKNLEKVFFSDSGSVSVEVAMKMALQYWFARGNNEKTEFISLRSGYHGDTWNAMSVCDPVTGMHNIFNDRLPRQSFAPSPPIGFDDEYTEDYLESLQQILVKKHHKIAAFIIEPIVQAAGGMRFYSPEYLRDFRNICDKFNILLIADEIATGFGRTGELFACDHADIEPDIICLGKAITGGYLSFATTLTTANVAETISSGDPGVFMHGPTFMGNPLACAVAAANIEHLLSYNWKSRISLIESGLKEGLRKATEYAAVADVRVLGAIGVVEMKEPVKIDEIQNMFVENGVWIRPFGKLIYVMPPYIINSDELKKLTNAIIYVISKINNDR